MKIPLWFLVFPYVVTVSTQERCAEYRENKSTAPLVFYGAADCLRREVQNTYRLGIGKKAFVECEEGAKDYCDDLADALNAAHERHNYGAGKKAEFTSECGGPGQTPCERRVHE